MGWAMNAEAPAREAADPDPPFRGVAALGYEGGYDAVRRLRGRARAKTNASATANAFVPLTFAPGEAYQFWSHEIVVLDGMTTTVKVAHVRLSRMMSVRASARGAGDRVRRARARVRVLPGCHA
jgi:hypothetical protein